MNLNFAILMMQRIAGQPGRWLVAGIVVLMLSSLCIADGQAQQADARIPENREAEALFDEALAAFERGDYALAQRRFQLVHEYPLHQKSTASLLMAGKALYRMEAYDRAEETLRALLRRYPNTSYRDRAEQLIEYIQQGASGTTSVIRLGIALPLTDDDAALAQALFNGIRLAVDEHNGLRRRMASPDEPVRLASADSGQAEGVVTERTRVPNQPIQMYFRDTRGTASGARAAVDSLVQMDRVDLIVGPLFSHEARAAAEAAERAGVVMIAPMATEESVSAGRRYVFQANPTITARGEAMARFAARGLLVDAAGIIVEGGNSISERMADGFNRGFRREGGAVAFYERLASARSWSRLPEHFEADSLSRDSLAQAEAVYLPIAGDDAAGQIQDALIGINWASQEYGLTLRVLGNAEWHDLPIKNRASQFTATYTNDFYVDETRADVQDFIRRYRLLTGQPPDGLGGSARRLAYTGYDVGQFVINRLSEGASAGVLADRLRSAGPYEGLGSRIHFDGDNVNQSLFIHRYRNGRIERVR